MSSRSIERVPTQPSLSPTPRKSQRQQNLEYTSTSQIQSKMIQGTTAQMQGLDLYGYRMSDALDDLEVSMPPVQLSTMAPTVSTYAVRSQHPSRSSPNILSAEYDPFAPFHSGMTSYNNSSLYAIRSTEISGPPPSPSLSAVNSHRSSFSSAPPSETYSSHESYHTGTRRVKPENPFDWYPESRNSLLTTASQAGSSVLSTSASYYPSSLEDTYFPPSGAEGWPRLDTLDTANFPATSTQATSSEAASRHSSETKGSVSSVTRTRAPRKMTTREEANYQCKVKGCGKFFSRSYNFKAHMETHDTGRVYPFPCPLSECNKKFVRKTDLQRHHQSVHMKERNYQCNFCSRFFARKDTLRRHMEDGCSKRFDVEFGVDQQNDTARRDSNNEPQSSPLQVQYYSNPMTYPPPTTLPPSSAPITYLTRAEYRGSQDNQGPLWGE